MEGRASLPDWLVFAALAAAVIAPVIRAGNSDFTYPDASRHAMDGVLVLDALREMPLDEPLDWAGRYYARSPAIAMGRYPPLMAILQAPLYGVLGVCPFAGRLATALLWLAGLLFFYETLKRALGLPGASFGALALASGPATLRWGGEVMLELPATAFALAAACLYLSSLDGNKRRRLTGAVLLACLAGWVKQPALLVLLPICVHLFFFTRPRPLLRDVWPAIVTAACLVVPLAAMSLAFGAANLALLSGAARAYPFGSLENWLCYVRAIPGYYAGLPVTVLAVVGAARLLVKRGTGHALFWAMWLGVFYGFFTFVGYKSLRLAMFWTPAIVFLAGVTVSWAAGKGATARSAWVACLSLLAVTGTYMHAWRALPPRGGHVRSAAVRALELLPQRVLYLGEKSGTFVFRIREIAGYERPAVVLASKVLYTDYIQEELGRSEYVSTGDELKDVLAAVAPDVVVVERTRRSGRRMPNAARLLLEYLGSDSFQFEAGIEAAPGKEGVALGSIDVYSYLGPRNPRNIVLQLPGAGMAVELPSESSTLR